MMELLSDRIHVWVIPETQVILPMCKNDLIGIIYGRGQLNHGQQTLTDERACATVILMITDILNLLKRKSDHRYAKIRRKVSCRCLPTIDQNNDLVTSGKQVMANLLVADHPDEATTGFVTPMPVVFITTPLFQKRYWLGCVGIIRLLLWVCVFCIKQMSSQKAGNRIYFSFKIIWLNSSQVFFFIHWNREAGDSVCFARDAVLLPGRIAVGCLVSSIRQPHPHRNFC